MLFGTMKVNNNELTIGGIKVSKLVSEYGSPLYVYDQQHIEDMIDVFQTNFTSSVFEARVAYASKAFLTKAMVQLLASKGMSLDCVSLGEMYTASAAGFDMSKTIIHGNNKSLEELDYALKVGTGYIVVDNIYELKELIEVASKRAQKVKTLLRVNPGIEAHTHEYIVTAKLTSKFGESIFDESRLAEIVELYKDNQYVSLEGFHCHIGSQVFGIDAFTKTVKTMIEFLQDTNDKYNTRLDVLNIGGGFGVYYTDGDDPVELPKLLHAIIETAENYIKENISLKEMIIEPGRSIVSNAGTTLYTIGYQKETYGGKNYVFVDGGMTDNIRPALYQAEYEADVATNMNGVKQGEWTVAGKLCESGDLLIKNTPLQPFDKNDILAIYTTGAYNYSMASNYNRMLKPAVVFVKDNKAKVVVKRETLEDVIRNDL